MHKIKGSRSTSAASTTTSAISIYSRFSIFRRYLLLDTARVRSTNSKIAGAGSCWLASTRSSAASWRDVPLVDDLQEVMRGGIATFFVKEAHDLTFLLLLGHLDVCFIILCNHRESSAKAQQNCCWSLNADLRAEEIHNKNITTKRIRHTAVAPSVNVELSSRKKLTFMFQMGSLLIVIILLHWYQQ